MLNIILKLTFDFSAMFGSGITISIVGYTVVFVALVLLYIVFKQIPKFLDMQARRRMKREGKASLPQEEELQMEGDVNAAIAMALYLYFDELHDEEDMVLTMKRIQRRYSHWSSKIYNVTNFQRLR